MEQIAFSSKELNPSTDKSEIILYLIAYFSYNSLRVLNLQKWRHHLHTAFNSRLQNKKKKILHDGQVSNYQGHCTKTTKHSFEYKTNGRSSSSSYSAGLSFLVLIFDPETYPSLAATSSRPSFPFPFPLGSNLWRWVPPYLDESVSRSKAAFFETDCK